VTGVVTFVYGTLTEPDQVAEVVDSFVFVGPAVVSGLHAVDGDYPTLAPGGSVGGRLLRTGDHTALDEYERVDDGLYTRVSVPTGEGFDEEAVAVYVGDPDRLGADVTWPGDGAFPARVRRYVDRESVVITRE
jgi:gamma-glutamylcyclotransferase (GGCT)/AIG2-like uncharacterized protein YtfP